MGPLGKASLVATMTATVGSCDPPRDEAVPFRDDWRIELDTEFPVVVDGDPQLTDIWIGGTVHDDNFAGRGDIIVEFDPSFDVLPGERGRVRVEARRFAPAHGEEEAEEIFDRIGLWMATRGAANPGFPDSVQEDEDCSKSWKAGCEVRVWYDGAIQPEGTGADLRVTLPASFAGKLTVRTEDNIAKEAYANRGDVCIRGLHSEAEVEVDSGRVFVELDDDVSVAPTCPPEAIEACEIWTLPDGRFAPWDATCPCTEFGTLKIGASGAADVFVDLPANLWATVRALNLDDPSRAQNCSADLDGLANGDGAKPSEPPYRQTRTTNQPEGAPPSLGYQVDLRVDRCAPVLFTNSPDAYVGPGDPARQSSQQRGNVVACNDCLGPDRYPTCEQVLSGAG